MEPIQATMPTNDSIHESVLNAAPGGEMLLGHPI